MRFSHYAAFLLVLCVLPCVADDKVDFNRDIRPILSNKCFACHGPDEENLEAGLRFDKRELAIGELESGSHALVPGKPAESEMLDRVASDDADVRMPPPEFGKALTKSEIETLKRWIEEDAPYATHWSYVKPERPQPPSIASGQKSWVKNEIDAFALDRMLQHGFNPSPEADRQAIARRVSLDLTGLPPSVKRVEAFVKDQRDDAYERFVDQLLASPAFGEHWARKWLDLARYADSAGYADDPPRTIWAYRDWVVRAINNGMPFDQFTIEQMAGDLLPNPTEDQLIATAFHRNTLTNNEGGTQDEEFRNVAVVDRVNTTMAVWMGTTMACAQCHTHKYDPITQTEYFQFFAILNSTQDRDRRDESPVLQLFTDKQKARRDELHKQIASLKTKLATNTPALQASQRKWEQALSKTPDWNPLPAIAARRLSGQAIGVETDGSLLVRTESLESLPAKDTYVVDFKVDESKTVSGLRLSVLPHKSLPKNGSGHAGGNFVITNLRAELVPNDPSRLKAKFVRVTNRGKQKFLSLAEVQVFSNGKNIATEGVASQNSTGFGGTAELAIDGDTNGDFSGGKSVTHTNTADDPWWEVQLSEAVAIEKVVVWNRTDNNLQSRLKDFTVELLDENREVLSTKRFDESPDPSVEYKPSNVLPIKLAKAFADYHQQNFEAQEALNGKTGKLDGWAIGGSVNKPHYLTVVPADSVQLEPGDRLQITIEQRSPHMRHLLGHFAFSTVDDPGTIERSRVPAQVLAILDTAATERSEGQSKKLAEWYRQNAAADLADERRQLAASEKAMVEMKPATSVPVLRELSKPRVSWLQYRGSYLDKGDEVQPGTPSAFHPAPDGNLNRLALAKWLVREDNPLTARVIANRYWESVFGRGIVLSSEEFGNQGEPPTHPQLLDWLATELVQSGWNTKQLLRTIVTSATYRQSSIVRGTAAADDPDNRWLARGPRVRLTAEMVRDQALFVSGLLSHKLYGPPVRPPQPNLGLKAAFGGSTDWKTSTGEDRYRRAIYTTWRRSNPYPSMATFDAPNREVCTVRRNRTNTPLQSLVTLNDPVYVEAAQSLARHALRADGSVENQIAVAFRRCTLREPTAEETQQLVALFSDAKAQLSGHEAEAKQLATNPLGELPESMQPINAAAMTVVANILLNLDEMFLKR